MICRFAHWLLNLGIKRSCFFAPSLSIHQSVLFFLISHNSFSYPRNTSFSNHFWLLLKKFIHWFIHMDQEGFLISSLTSLLLKKKSTIVFLFILLWLTNWTTRNAWVNWKFLLCICPYSLMHMLLFNLMVIQHNLAITTNN